MIFTDRFVYVHAPKTGGTFVTSVLLRLHGFRWHLGTRILSALRPELARTGPYGRLVYHRHKHGGCNDLPAEQRDKLVLATVRNPYDLYVSEYEFGWWKRRELRRYFEAVPGFRQQYGHFPELTFAEYLALANLAFSSYSYAAIAPEDRPGVQTQAFVKFYWRDPAAAAGIDEASICAGAYRDQLWPIQFIHTDRLNAELYQFLLDMGYAAADLAFIPGLGKILPGGQGRTHEQRWERYYTPELKQLVRHKERLIFAMFPEFDT